MATEMEDICGFYPVLDMAIPEQLAQATSL